MSHCSMFTLLLLQGFASWNACVFVAECIVDYESTFCVCECEPFCLCLKWKEKKNTKNKTIPIIACVALVFYSFLSDLLNSLYCGWVKVAANCWIYLYIIVTAFYPLIIIAMIVMHHDWCNIPELRFTNHHFLLCDMWCKVWRDGTN